MNELIQMIKKREINKLFISPTDNKWLQLFRYFFVGGISFAADTITLLTLNLAGLHYLFSAAFAFILGLTINFYLSKKLIFTNGAIIGGPLTEYSVYGVIGLFGLGLTELLLYIAIEFLGLYLILSKIIVAAAVLVWNFSARKMILYRRTDMKWE